MDVIQELWRKHWKLLLALSIAAMLIAACSGKNDKEIVKERALKYWTLKSQKKVRDMYEFESPHFRDMVSSEQYVKYYTLITEYGQPDIVNVAIDDEGKTADVKIKIIAGINPPGFKNTFRHPLTVTDQWVKGSDGIWYHVPAKSMKVRK